MRNYEHNHLIATQYKRLYDPRLELCDAINADHTLSSNDTELINALNLAEERIGKHLNTHRLSVKENTE